MCSRRYSRCPSRAIARSRHPSVASGLRACWRRCGRVAGQREGRSRRRRGRDEARTAKAGVCPSIWRGMRRGLKARALGARHLVSRRRAAWQLSPSNRGSRCLTRAPTRRRSSALLAGSCAIIKSPASRGSRRSARKSSAEFWPTKWVSVKRCRQSLQFVYCCAADRRGGSY